MTKRFQQIIIEIFPGREPWAPLTAEQLTEVAALLDERDVLDIVGELKALSAEKDLAPDWDGDTQDDIAKAQETLARLLGLLAKQYRATIEQQLGTVDPLTRAYLEIALR